MMATDHQVEAGGAESLALEGAVADFAALVEEHRPGQLVAGLALVQPVVMACNMPLRPETWRAIHLHAMITRHRSDRAVTNAATMSESPRKRLPCRIKSQQHGTHTYPLPLSQKYMMATRAVAIPRGLGLVTLADFVKCRMTGLDVGDGGGVIH